MNRTSLATLTAALLTTVAAVLTVPTASASMPAAAPLSTPSPSTSGCAAANFVCLYDGVGLTGQQIAVRPAERGGCIDLGALGWAGRARSAKNTFTREAVSYPNRDCTGRPDGIRGNSEAASLLFAPGSVWVFDACSTTGILCLYERVDFNGAEFTVRALDPATGTCVDLVAHGWGGRAASAVNTNTAPATLYTGSNCTGLSRVVAGNSWDRALSFAAGSVFVH
jgi:hypothetical protein